MSLKSIDGVPVYDRPFYYHWKILFFDDTIVNEYSAQDGTHRTLKQIAQYHKDVSKVKGMSWVPFTVARANAVNVNVGYRATAVSDTNLPSFQRLTDGVKPPYAMRRVVEWQGKLIRVYMLGENRQASTFLVITEWGASKEVPTHIIKRYV